MGGDAYALALRAGAQLIDMEFPQFFPIGHLAPRLIGMDPIMWDPFRYKLGGKLLKGIMSNLLKIMVEQMEKLIQSQELYLASYAIIKEVQAGRGSPNGGVAYKF